MNLNCTVGTWLPEEEEQEEEEEEEEEEEKKRRHTITIMWIISPQWVSG